MRHQELITFSSLVNSQSKKLSHLSVKRNKMMTTRTTLRDVAAPRKVRARKREAVNRRIRKRANKNVSRIKQV